VVCEHDVAICTPATTRGYHPQIFLNQPSPLRVLLRVYTLYHIYNVTSTYWYATPYQTKGQSTNTQLFYPSTTRLAYSPLPRALKLLDSDSSEVEVPPSRSGKLVSRLSKLFSRVIGDELTDRDVSSITKAPEMLGGRVKTLHPAVHGGESRDKGYWPWG
jgi:hypothetical protein